jgi:hypothetical protein
MIVLVYAKKSTAFRFASGCSQKAYDLLVKAAKSDLNI